MNYDETMTTLQFASRAIKIRLSVHINERIEMKKIKEKLQDLNINKIQKYDSVLKESKKLERDANELKSSLNHLRNELRRAKSKTSSRINEDHPENIHHENINNHQENVNNHHENFIKQPSQQNINNQNPNNQNSNNQNNHQMPSVEFVNINKKFQAMILHLQSELARATVTINSLKEENKTLRDQLKK
jgi:hypothetical protein